MFKEYQSKPIVREAMEIMALPAKIEDKESTYTYNGVEFKAYEQPQIGDWVVRLTEEDTYHVSDKVFRERNIVF